MDEKEQLIWSAGFFSGLGGFQIVNNNGSQVIRFQGTTGVHKEAMLKLADAMEVNVTQVTIKGKKGDTIAYKIACSSKPLHRAMVKMWPYLTTSRKREYQKLRKELAA